MNPFCSVLQQELARYVLSHVFCVVLLDTYSPSKMNAAMLIILNELGKWHDESIGMFSLDAFKIVYVAPMKALVLQEMVGNFNLLQGPICTKVGELTGDLQMTSSLMRSIFSMMS